MIQSIHVLFGTYLLCILPSGEETTQEEVTQAALLSLTVNHFHGHARAKLNFKIKLISLFLFYKQIYFEIDRGIIPVSPFSFFFPLQIEQHPHFRSDSNFFFFTPILHNFISYRILL